MRKRTSPQSSIVGEPIENANNADICFYNKETDNKVIVDANEFTAEEYPLSSFTPIGIVVIPSSHTNEGRPRIISLANMSCITPNKGSVYKQTMCFGGRNFIIEDLSLNTKFPYIGNVIDNLTNDSQVRFSDENCYLSSDSDDFNYENPMNLKEHYYYRGLYLFKDYFNYMCSPYKEDDSKDERYFDTSNTSNVLADFDGKGNTEKILSVDNSYSTDWQLYLNVSNKGYNQYVHPAAECCYRFHTDGTNQGDWYLPSAGELGYVIARKHSIDNVIRKINKEYLEEAEKEKEQDDELEEIKEKLDKPLGSLLSNSIYWTSTQYSDKYSIYICFNNGYVNAYYKCLNCCVRAFLIL